MSEFTEWIISNTPNGKERLKEIGETILGFSVISNPAVPPNEIHAWTVRDGKPFLQKFIVSEPEEKSE